MSRVYDALQQCAPDHVSPDVLRETQADALFPEQFAGAMWDPAAGPVVQPDLSREDRLPVLFSAHSFASEQFRLLAARLQQVQQGHAFKSVLLTSSIQGEGKSLLSLNLAFSLAQGGQQRVVIVDADLRKPGLSSTLGMEGRPGITDWYQNNRPLTEVVCRIADCSLWVLPVGTAAVDPLQLLKSTRAADLLTSLNTPFDWVLIDSPPLLPLADAEIISRICDATIMIVRRETTPKTSLGQALDRVAPSKLIGLLLNDFPSLKSYAVARYAPKKYFNNSEPIPQIENR